MKSTRHRNPLTGTANTPRQASRGRWTAAALVLAAGWANVSLCNAQAVSTTFTYQGELSEGGAPVDGVYDLLFRLYDAQAGGAQIGTTLCVDNVTVINGRFTVQLDFGGQFASQQRFLDIQVRLDTGLGCPNTTGYTLLAPRTTVTAAPHASYAATAGTATSAGNAAQLNSQPASFYQNAANLTSGTVPEARLAANVVRTGTSNTFTGTNIFAGPTTFSGAMQSTNPASVYAGNGSALTGLWKLGGNIGTDSSQFIGTTDTQPLKMRVANREGASLTPSFSLWGGDAIFSVNVNHGADTNFIWPGISGATIGGGGVNPYNNGALMLAYRNNVSDNFGTVAGGVGNRIEPGGQSGFVGGGFFNRAAGQGAIVVGGQENAATNTRSFVGGGYFNAATGDHSVVSGGYANSASGGSAFVAGGANCVAQGTLSAAMGNHARALHSGSFVWADSTDALFDSSGDNQFLIRSGGGVMINTNTPVGSASLVVRGTQSGNSYSGMYADTIDDNGIAFLGYATAGNYRAWTQYNGVNGDWSLVTPFVAGNTVPMKCDIAGNMLFTNRVGIGTLLPGARLDVRGAATGTVNIFTGDLDPPGLGGIITNFSTAGIGSNPLLRCAVDNTDRFTVDGFGDAYISRDLQTGGFVSATGTLQSVSGNVLAGSKVTLDQSGSNTGMSEVRLRGIFSDPLGLSIEQSTSYSIINLDNNFRMEGRTVGARGGILRIDGRDYSFGLPLFQFWHKATQSGTENQVMSIDHNGNVAAAGSLSAPAKFFVIDNPSDPANSTLRHACIESDEYKNIYDGVVTTDGTGYATITLPSWMTDLNENFRYQLTVIDESDSGDPFMWARVVRKLDSSNTFTVRTSGGGMEVSWQVTGTRKDAWAKANAFTPVTEKPATGKGRYLSPEAFNQPANMGTFSREAIEARAATAKGVERQPEGSSR